MSFSKKDVLLDQLAACHNDLSWFPTFLDSVKGLPKLDTQVLNYPGDYPWWAAISNLCTHNAYHIGQIVLIRKQQGWANI